MKRILNVGLLGVILAVAAYFTWRMMLPPPAGLDLARAKPSEAGLYHVAISPEIAPFDRSRVHSWVVRVRSPAGEPVSGAAMSIDGAMPQHGHGLPTTPRITATLVPGDYLLQGIRFGMSGWWVLRLTIDADAGSDKVEFNLTL